MVKKKKKERKNISTGIAHINSSFNNTKVLISDVQGNAIAWSSTGAEGFKGSRKSTPFAAQLAAESAGKKAKDNGHKIVNGKSMLILQAQKSFEIWTGIKPNVDDKFLNLLND